MKEIKIPDEYLVTDSGTSDGTQIKYFYNNKWYKVDRYGGEGKAEELASKILMCLGFPTDKYVQYEQIFINGNPGCVSDNFLHDGESFVSFYRLYSNIKGRDLATVTSTMDYDDAIEYVVSFMKEYTGLDIRRYLANTFALDSVILNEDRHFNNLGVIFDGANYLEAPIFDNGKSLFVGNEKYNETKTIRENKKCAFAKAFSGSFEQNYLYLKAYASLVIDKNKIVEGLKLLQNEDAVAGRLYDLLEL